MTDDEAIWLSSSSAASDMTSLSEVFSTPLFRYLLHFVRGVRQAAEDLLQETMLRAWRNFAAMPQERESQRRWLFAIAHNVAVDAERRRRARPAECAVDLDLLAEGRSESERVDAVHDLRKAFATLPAIHRDVLVELYYRDQSLAEAAGRLGVPEGTVKSRAHYALCSLRAALS
jgi:RNA polymerase sigma-70 factor (ECF subfamily)